MDNEKKLIDLLVDDNRTRKVSVLGRDVYVSQSTLEEQSKAVAMFPEDLARRQASLLILKCRDAAGKPIFTSDDRDALATQVGGNRFVEAWAVINGATVDAQAEK